MWNRQMKKNRKEIVKRQKKAREKARQKRQVRKVRPMPAFMERPPISQAAAPQGFMAVSSSQAMIKYAEPLMETTAGDNKHCLLYTSDAADERI